jgi:hypothetical protein
MIGDCSSLHPRGGAAVSRDPVRTAILIHNDAASGVQTRPVVHQAAKYLVPVWNGRPAHPESIIDAGLSLFGSFRPRG